MTMQHSHPKQVLRAKKVWLSCQAKSVTWPCPVNWPQSSWSCVQLKTGPKARSPRRKQQVKMLTMEAFVDLWVSENPGNECKGCANKYYIWCWTTKKKSHYRVHTLCFQSFQSFILESAVSIVMEMVWFSSCDLLFQSHDSSSGPCDRNCKWVVLTCEVN